MGMQKGQLTPPSTATAKPAAGAPSRRSGRTPTSVPIARTVVRIRVFCAVRRQSAESVRGRLAEFPRHERVVPGAAVMRRHFGWAILPAASRQFPEVVSCALVGEAETVLITAGAARFEFATS
jgi:hypothetical protein